MHRLQAQLPLQSSTVPMAVPCLNLNVSATPGKKIREMLLAAGGDLKQLELTVKRRVEKREEEAIEGRYVTEIMLEAEGWDKEMIANSKRYADERGNLRTSEVHGKEEWKIPMVHSFKKVAGLYQSVETSASTQVEELLLCHTHVFTLGLRQDTEGAGLDLDLSLGSSGDGGRLVLQPACDATSRTGRRATVPGALWQLVPLPKRRLQPCRSSSRTIPLVSWLSFVLVSNRVQLPTFVDTLAQKVDLADELKDWSVAPKCVRPSRRSCKHTRLNVPTSPLAESCLKPRPQDLQRS